MLIKGGQALLYCHVFQHWSTRIRLIRFYVEHKHVIENCQYCLRYGLLEPSDYLSSTRLHRKISHDYSSSTQPHRTILKSKLWFNYRLHSDRHLGPMVVNSTHWGRKTDNVFKLHVLNEKHCILIKIWLIFFSWSQLTINQEWFKWWLDADQATNHYQNQRPCLLSPYIVTRPQSVYSYAMHICVTKQMRHLFSDAYMRKHLTCRFICQTYQGDHLALWWRKLKHYTGINKH